MSQEPYESTENPYRSPLNQSASRRPALVAWAMYDWANSAYSTLSITVLVTYLQSAVLPGKSGVIVWGYGIGLMGLVVAVLSPTLGAWADTHASKRKWLAGTAWLGAGATALMFFATPDRPWLLVVLFLCAQFGMELSQTFYNGFLTEIASAETMDRVSAQGYALGYVGGGLALLGFMLLYNYGGQLGLPDPDVNHLRPRLGLLLAGLWWGVFTIPAVVWLRDRGVPIKRDDPITAAARNAFREVFQTLRHVRRYQMLTLFLIGFLFYNDGVQTVISQASVFAGKALQMESGELALLVLMIQFVAAPGALLVGKLSDKLGAKTALQLCLVVWVTLLVCAYFVTSRTHFWIMGAAVGLVMGGTQSVSRTIMGLMTPPERTAEFFGFFNLSGKAISMFGPIVFATTLAWTDSPHYAILSLLGFFIIGWLFIWRLDVTIGRAQAVAAPH